MTWLNLFRSRVRAFFRSSKLDRDMEDEMQFHLDMRAEKGAASGLSTDDARLHAAREFGGLDQIKEQCREQRTWTVLEQVCQDFGYGLRGLFKHRVFTATVVLTLAVGIGLNTVLFTFYRTVALKPLPVSSPNEIVRVFSTREARTEYGFSFDQFQRVAALGKPFSAVIASSDPQIVVIQLNPENLGPADLANIRFVSNNYFKVLGITAQYGQVLNAENQGLVLSYEYWRSHFGSDSKVIGTLVLLNGIPTKIVGVAPRTFAGTGMPAQSPACWVPFTLQPLIMPRTDWINSEARQWQIIGRRRAELSISEADTIFRTAFRREGIRGEEVGLQPATFFQIDSGEFKVFRSIVPLGMLVEGIVLLIGCVNVVNLLSARNSTRVREFSIRLALGATRGRLLRQLCVESIQLGILGGGGGLLLSFWITEFIRVWIVETFKRLSGEVEGIFLDTAPDWTVYLYTSGLAAAIGIVIGIVPALRAIGSIVKSKQHPGIFVRGEIHAVATGRRNLLLSVQVGTCLFLLFGAALLFRGVASVRAVDAGFDRENLFVLAVKFLPISPEEIERTRIAEEVLKRVARLSQVASISWADHPPFWGRSVASHKNADGTKESWALNGISGNFFETVGLPLVAGRSFTAPEIEESEAVAIVNETAAKHLWPSENPVGKVVSAPGLAKLYGRERCTVVGVVKDARTSFLSKPDGVNIYVPKRLPNAVAVFLVRTRGPSDQAVRALFSTLRDVDPNLPTQSWIVRLEDGPVRAQLLMSEAPATIAAVLALIGLGLAAIGIYGVVSFLITNRQQEIGIRMALGAGSSEIVRMIFGQTFRPIAWGASIGIAGAVGLSVTLAKLLASPQTPDFTGNAGAFPINTMVLTIIVLFAAVASAAYFPTRRALRADPMDALRVD